MSAVRVEKNGRPFRFRSRFHLVVPSCIITLVVLHRGHVQFSKFNSLDGANNATTTARKEARTRSSIGSDDDDENAVSESSIEEGEPIITRSSNAVVVPMIRRSSAVVPIKPLDPSLEPSNVPIYVSDPLFGSVSSMDYRYFASIWDRDTTYDDILLYASSSANDTYNASSSSSSSSADEELRRKLEGNNATVIFHTSPKTASSTVRNACLQTQYDSCHMPRKSTTMKWPDGYRSPKRLAQLFGECPETRHFCVRGGIPVVKGYGLHYETRTFVHMFPFRNYDEWTVSALHQIYYRDGEEGCREAEELLDECLPHRFELDFEKYTKSILSNFVVRYRALRSSGKKANYDRHHIVLLYDYRNLHETLTWLNESYGVPLLPGTGDKVNAARPDESCTEEESLLGKFHDCFSGDLAGLHNTTVVQRTGRRKKKSGN